jgi:tetraacyldisaccharide 4'-kinase
VRLIERIWSSDDAVARAARSALIPFEAAYRGVIEARSWLYDRQLLGVRASPIPVVSVGNLSVGGTGKTPFAAWIAHSLASRGAVPAIVLRGYGGDESHVHARLNPDIPVIVNARRAQGIAEAARNGATVAVLDDAFQHREADRNLDIVLLAAEQWSEPLRLLPAGPWREPLSAIRRAGLIVITRKTAHAQTVDLIAQEVGRIAPEIPLTTVRLTPRELHRAEPSASDTLPLSALSNTSIVAIAGVADPTAFFEQLAEAGGRVSPMAFRDHHAFNADDVQRILARARNDALIVCTLKDAVKLTPLWPASAPPLWYVLQTVTIESGADALARSLSQFLTQNPAYTP